MSENNIEKEEIKEEQLESEEAVEVSVNEEQLEGEEAVEAIVNDEQETEVKSETKKSRVSFLKSFSAVIVDEVIIGIISVIVLYIFDALLKLGGYFVAQRVGMLLLIFVVVSVLYTSIMEAGKQGKTVGKRLLKF